MSNVYFMPCSDVGDVDGIRKSVRELLTVLTEREKIPLQKKIPLKVHFGEKGNKTYLKPETYAGIIDFLGEREIESCYIETSVLYGGERFERDRHIRLALSHGFTQLPIVIADGAKGEDAVDVRIDRKHFRTCAIARELAVSRQVLVLSHFKGHMLAGFGGAIKQLAMGFAAKGGKMAMHMSVKPRIRNWKCRHCGLCLKRCNAGAITIDGKKSKIDPERCIGCGACFSICPHHAVSIYSLKGFWNALFRGRFFREKLAEYALAAHKDKQNIYINFALNITRGCDCEPRSMRPCVPDIGIFASTDPVAVDTACWEASARLGKTWKGAEQLAYAEKIGLGSRSYHFIEIQNQEEKK